MNRLHDLSKSQFNKFISELPIPIPSELNFDGQFHRFGEGEKGKEPHWYIGTQKGDDISFTVGSHKYPELKSSFQSKSKFSHPLWRRGSTLHEKWESCRLVDYHPYLDRKHISGLFGAKINFFGDLVIPMFSTLNDELIGLQTINHDGEKRFISGSKKKGAYFEIVGAISESSNLYVAEGFSTAVTIYLATGSRVICAFDCSNLPTVVQRFVQRCPNLRIIVAGDDDKFSKINAGRNAASMVSRISNAIFPTFNSYEGNPTDWNDLYIREGIEAVKTQISNAIDTLNFPVNNRTVIDKLSHQTSDETIEMVSGKDLEDSEESIIDEVLPSLVRGHVGILCSPGGYGKSGVALLMANQIASGGQKDFLGFGSVSGGSAVILTLEDPVDVYAARQKELLKDLDDQEKKLVRENLHLVKALCVQNAVDSQDVVKIIRENYRENDRDISTLRLLVIDHLSYWSSLDLNESQSASILMKEFRRLAESLNCAVLLLHHSNRTAMVKGKDKQTGSAAMGGSYKFHALSRWVAVIECQEDGKSQSKDKILELDKANHGKKFKFELTHRADRSGLLYKQNFEILALTKSMDAETYDIETIPKEEVENFNLGEASPKLLKVDENTHHIMNWLSRNPAFETVSHAARKALTDVVDGKDHDKDRPVTSIYRDVWVQGDTLIIDGPVCDQEDMKLFALLVNELTCIHNNGARGLILELSLSQILALSGLNASGPNFNKVHRQLDRLRRMALDFKNSRGHRWRGPLINDVFTIGEGRSCKVRIGFNHFMVTFYKIQEYTMFHKSIAHSLKGDSLSFYIFYASQNLQSMKISVDKCKKLLGISPSFDKKEAMKKIKKSIHDLIAAGVMDSEKTFIKDGYVYTSRAGGL